MNTNNGNVNNNTKSNTNTNNRVRAFIALDKILINQCNVSMIDHRRSLYLISIEDFFKAYEDCRKRKRTTINALKFEVDYERKLVNLYREVNEKRYVIGKSITFIVTRPKLREVFAADFRDRVIHHIIMQRLEPLFEEAFIEDSYSCRKGKGTLYGVLRLRDKIKECSNNYTEECWVGKFDLKGFFMSIHKPTLWSMLEKFIQEKYNQKDKELLLYLVKTVVLHSPQYNCIKKSPDFLWQQLPKNKSLFTCDPDRGIPIGNLTSQCFANFYLDPFDQMMNKLFGGFYGRYVDDFFVVAKTKKEITKRIREMKRFLERELKLTLHPDKIYIQKYEKGVKFIGSVVKKDKIKIGSVTMGGLYKAIYKYNKETPSVEKAIHFMQTLNSYLGFMTHGESFYRRQKIWNKIDKRWHFYLYHTKDYKKVLLDRRCDPRKIIQKELKYNKDYGKYF